MTKQELEDIRKTIETIALDAGKQIHRSVESLAVVVQKERMDVATATDIEIETYIKDRLHTSFPTHAFYAEESGGIIDPNIPTWIIDPIDGTKEFIRDIPIFCTTFCLTLQGDVLVSVVYNPKTQELFSSAKGNGAYKNGKRVYATSEREISKAHLFFRLPDYSEGKRMQEILDGFKSLARVAYRVRGIANQNIALCWVGMGGYDGYINIVRSDNPWDYAPGSLFLTEAGGELAFIEGQMLDIAKADRRYVAANPQLCKAIMKLLVEK